MTKQGNHRLLAPLYQAVTALSQSATQPASAIRRTAVARTGNGEIALAGPYTGAADTTVDVQITSGTGTARVTEPQFSGIGTGTLTDLAVTVGTAQQTVTVTLLDAGTQEQAATIDLGGVRLVATAAGDDGNAVTLAVDESGLVASSTNYSLTAELAAGTEDTTSGGADFGGPLGTPDLVPATALRIRIGQDLGQIYTHWRSFRSGILSYHFRPALRRAYAVGDAVYAITGTRSVEVTDGVSTETYASITTLSDLLAAIAAGSALLQVDGPIDPSRAADNAQGTQDLSIRTASRIDDAGGTGSSYAQLGPINISVGDAASELIEATCEANSAAGGAALGHERWTVRGSVSGALGTFRSGDEVTGPAGRFRFQIAQRVPPDYDPDDTAPISAAFSIADVPSSAAVTADPIRAGIAAASKSITYTYRQRAIAACNPLAVSYSALANVERWLGFDLTDEEGNALALDPDYQTRLESLYAWRSDFAASNTAMVASTYPVGALAPDVRNLDLDLCDGITTRLARALRQIYTSADGLDDWDAAFTEAQADVDALEGMLTGRKYRYADLWAAATAYEDGRLIRVPETPGLVHRCVEAGTSGTASPSDEEGGVTAWDDATAYVAGQRVTPTTPNGWIYECVNPGLSGATEPGVGAAGAIATAWRGATAYSLGDQVLPWTKNNCRYVCTTAGTSGSAQPTWGTTHGGTTADGGTLVWTCVRYRTASAGYNAGDSLEPGDGFVYRAVTAGTASSTEPTWTGIAGEITDGTVRWHIEQGWPTVLNAVTADGGVTWKAASQTWAPATAYAKGYTMLPGNGLAYRAAVGGYSGTSAPTWPSSGSVDDGQVVWVLLAGWATTVGNLTYDGTCVWEAAEQYWDASTAYALNDLMEPYNGYQYKCTDDGTSGASEPVWPTAAAEFTDGTAKWTRQVGSGTDLSTYAVTDTVNDYLRKWDARADQILATGGVEPSFSSAAASSTDAGSELWRDVGHTWWWVAEGADYLPIFSNTEYVSCRRRTDGTIESTQEFSIAIRVGTCATLADGDSVTITLGDARWGNTYLVGDTLHLTTIAGAPLACTGGADADADQTWAVSGSVDGALDLYTCDPDAPALYSDGGIAFKLHQGGIPYAAGDLWTFGIEAGTYKYRVGAGAWSADTDIGPKSLSSGLALSFSDGVSPSFVAGDTASFGVLQPYAADHALTPNDDILSWTGTGTVITAVCTGTVDAVLIARHTLPSTAVVRVQSGTLDQTMTWRAGPMVLLLASALTSPTLTITITVATGGTIGWLWAGAAHQTDLPAETQTRRVRHAMQRGGGANPAGLRIGSGAGYAVEFSGWLTQAEVDQIEALIAAAKTAGDWPVVWLPHASLPGEATLVRLPDEIEIRDWSQYWNPATADRLLEVSLELEPWLTP